MPKSNKQKCLEMWQWLRDHPQKSKGAYKTYLKSKGRLKEWHHCWACEEDELLGGKNCENCPIDFPKVKKDSGIPDCYHDDSSYSKWNDESYSETDAFYDSNLRFINAAAMVALIRGTWKEEK